MRNSYAKTPKKKRRNINFKPSMSLEEFADRENLNLFVLEATIKASDDITSQYIRGVTHYYHIVKLEKWLAENKVLSNA